MSHRNNYFQSENQFAFVKKVVDAKFYQAYFSNKSITTKQKTTREKSMSLEDAIKALTVAVEANTKAVGGAKAPAFRANEETIAAKEKAKTDTKPEKADTDTKPEKADTDKKTDKAADKKKGKKTAALDYESDVKPLILELCEKTGSKAAAKKILKGFGVEKGDELDEDQYADVVEQVEEALDNLKTKSDDDDDDI